MRYDVNYYNNGKDWFTLTDGRTVSKADPVSWNSGTKRYRNDLLNQPVYATPNYTASTRVLNSKSSASTSTQVVGFKEDFLFDYTVDLHADWTVVWTDLQGYSFAVHGGVTAYFDVDVVLNGQLVRTYETAYGLVTNGLRTAVRTATGDFDFTMSSSLHKLARGAVLNYDFSVVDHAMYLARSRGAPLADERVQRDGQGIAFTSGRLSYRNTFNFTSRFVPNMNNRYYAYVDPNYTTAWYLRSSQKDDYTPVPAITADRVVDFQAATNNAKAYSSVTADWITETFRNSYYNWESKYADVTDTRQELSFQMVTQPQDIYDLRPKFETGEKTVKVVENKSVTQWKTENITEDQTVITTTREWREDGSALQAAFTEASITTAGPITIAAGQDVTIHALVQSTGADQVLTVSAGRDVLLDGTVPDGAEAGTLSSVAALSADGRILINAVQDVLLGQFSNVEVDVDSGTGVLASDVGTISEVQISAGRDISLDGRVTAGNRIQASAGTVGSGSLTASVTAELKTNAAEILLAAGASAGDVTLTGALLNEGDTTGQISLLALGGRVAQSDSTLAATRLTAHAALGVTATTDVDEYDVSNTGAGTISLVNLSDVVFVDDLLNCAGSVYVTVFGDVTVGNVSVSDEINIQSSKGLIQAVGTRISGGNLTVATSDSDLTLATAVQGLTVTTRGVGNLTVHNTGTEPLSLNLNVTNGSLNVDTLGNLLVSSVVSLTDSDANDISLTAGGNIEVGLLKAGRFAATEAEAKALRLIELSNILRSASVLSASDEDLTDTTYASLDQAAARTTLVTWLQEEIFAVAADHLVQAEAEADSQLSLTQPIRVAGDVTLTATGAITELDADDDSVDLVADTLTIVSCLGVREIETSLNEITSITNVSGDITLSDVDSVGETSPGLIVNQISNQNGAVSITAPGELTVHRISALGSSGDVSLTAGGTLELAAVNAVLTSVIADNDLRLYAGGDLVIGNGISGLNTIDLKAEGDFTSAANFNFNVTGSLSIESGRALGIEGDFQSSVGVTLISNSGDVEVTGHIGGRNGAALPSLTIISRGNLITDGAMQGMYRFRSLSDHATYYSDAAELMDSTVVKAANGSIMENVSDLLLVPYTTIESALVKDVATGLDFFRDPQSAVEPADQDRYLRSLVSGTQYYRETDEITGWYPFSARTNIQNQISTFIKLWSTTPDPSQGTLYAETGTQTLNYAELDALEPQLVPVTDAAIISRLVPLTLKDVQGGRAIGTSISLDNATIGNVTDAVKLMAQ